MKLISEIVEWHDELSRWRRDIHAYPELAYEESRTSNFVAQQLESYGIKVTRGVGKTGVVGTLKVGSSDKAIGLRADMDALPMEELNEFAHKSKHKGVMHGCGHDGHTVMLLATARYLAQSKNFDGTIHFIFQPAEEANDQGSGAKAMIDDGLFDRFPVDNIFAMHNGPSFMAGAIGTCAGPIMASVDLFDVTITAVGCHGAFPFEGNDPIMVMNQMVAAWQTIISRNVNTAENAVLSVCSVNAGDSWNVIPESAVIRGTVRAFSAGVRQLIETRFRAIAENTAQAFGATVEINYRSCAPACINDPVQTAFACDVADKIFGKKRVLRTLSADMGGEDFSCMLQERPGCYLIIGAARESEGPVIAKETDINTLELDPRVFQPACQLHQPDYDFNDEIIPQGASLFVGLAEAYLCSGQK